MMRSSSWCADVSTGGGCCLVCVHCASKVVRCLGASMVVTQGAWTLATLCVPEGGGMGETVTPETRRDPSPEPIFLILEKA